MKLKVAQVIGLNTDQKAAQVLSSIQSDENAFFGLIILECDDAFTQGRQALSEIADFYFEYEGTPAQKLSEAFKFSGEKLKAVSQFSLILSSISGKVLYLLGKGDAEVYLKREGKISQLLSVGQPSELISGFLQIDDRVLMSTKNLTTFLSDDLSSALDLEIEVFEEEISNRVSSGNFESDGLSGLLVEIAEEEKEQIAIPQLEQEEEAETVYDTGFKLGELIEKLITPLLNIKKVIGGGKRLVVPRSGKGRLILGILLLLIILAGIGFKFVSSKQKVQNEQFNQALQSAKVDFDAAKGLSSLNPIQSKEKLSSANNNLNKALSLKPKDPQALDLKKQIDTESPSILQQFTASDFPLFLDLDLIKKGFFSSYMSISAGKLLLLDPNSKTLISVDKAKKSNQTLAGESQLGKATLSSLNGEFAFVFSEDKGIIRIDSTNQKTTSVAKSDSELGKISDIYAFASNIYLLDSLKSQIWKYLPTTDGYSDKREYLTKNTKVDLASAVRMQIESSVYVLSKDGAIFRFTKGDKDNFSYEGLDKGVNNPKSFFVSSDTENLYVLDSGNSRILILTKTGSYKGQINGAKFATASDLVVDEEGKKVYLLEGSKIYSVDLK